MVNGKNESSSNDKALDAVNRQRQGFFRPSIQNAMGALMVVLVTTSAGMVFAIRDLARTANELIEDHTNDPHAKHPVEWKEFDALRDAFNIHENDGKRKHALIDKALDHEHKAMEEMRQFMREGGRYTHQDGERDRADVERLRVRVRELEKQVQQCGCSSPLWRRDHKIPGVERHQSIPGHNRHSHPVKE